LPFDRAHWTRLGCSKDDLAGAGSDRLMYAVVAWGSEAAIRSRIQGRLDAGANHVCVQPVRLDGQSVPADEAMVALAAQAAVGQGRSRAEPSVVPTEFSRSLDCGGGRRAPNARCPCVAGIRAGSRM
jgi:hypothetical protein